MSHYLYTGDKILMTTERPFLFAPMLQVSKWSLRDLILYTFLMILYMYIAPGQGQKTRWRQNFWCQQEALITSTICCKFQTNLFEFWFYTHFFQCFSTCIQSCGRGRQPFVDKFWCQHKGLDTLPICCKFQKTYLWSLILYIIFHVFKHVYIAPGQGQITPWGQNFYISINLLSLWSFAVSFFH